MVAANPKVKAIISAGLSQSCSNRTLILLTWLVEMQSTCSKEKKILPFSSGEQLKVGTFSHLE